MEMLQKQSYKSPEISVVKISGDQAFAAVNGSQVDSNIKSLEIYEEEW